MDSIKDLLSDPLKGTKQAQGVLCYLFREVLLWRRVNQFSWNRMSKNYFAKPHNQINPDKGNLHKALKADDLPWNGFKKAIDFLNPIKATLSVNLIWGNGTNSEYCIIVDPVEDEKEPTSNNFPWDHCELFNGKGNPSTLLGHLFRHIVATESVKHKDVQLWWSGLFDSFMKNPANVVGLNQKEINTLAANLKRSLLDPNITWNTFRRGLYLLRTRTEEYTLTLHWSDDPTLQQALPDTVRQVSITDPHYMD